MAADPHAHCVTGAFIPASALAGTGSETSAGGVPAFRVPGTAARAGQHVVLVTDIFGWRLPNVRKLAEDLAAASGLSVWVPDVIGGGEECGVDFDRATLPAWFSRHNDETTLPVLKAFLAGLRAEQGAKFVGTLGFCWGARYALLVAQGPSPLVNAFAVAHPTKTEPSDYAAAAVPGLFLLAETDMAFPAEAVAAVRALPQAAALPFAFVGPAPGTVHGFVVRGSDEDPRVAEARAQARAAAADFFAAQAGAAAGGGCCGGAKAAASCCGSAAGTGCGCGPSCSCGPGCQCGSAAAAGSSGCSCGGARGAGCNCGDDCKCGS